MHFPGKQLRNEFHLKYYSSQNHIKGLESICFTTALPLVTKSQNDSQDWELVFSRQQKQLTVYLVSIYVQVQLLLLLPSTVSEKQQQQFFFFYPQTESSHLLKHISQWLSYLSLAACH